MQDSSAHRKTGRNWVERSPAPGADGLEATDPGRAPADRLPPPMFPTGSPRGRPRDAGTRPDPRERDLPVAEAPTGAPHPTTAQGTSEAAPADRALHRRMTDAVPAESAAPADKDAPGPTADEETQIQAVSGGDPHVQELIRLVRKLSDSLLRKGEAGLRATPDMMRFEETLRAYCVGFLAASRAVDRPRPPA